MYLCTLIVAQTGSKYLTAVPSDPAIVVIRYSSPLRTQESLKIVLLYVST